jgi:hypothetical protein
LKIYPIKKMQDLFGIFKHGYTDKYQGIITPASGLAKNPYCKSISRLPISERIKTFPFE